MKNRARFHTIVVLILLFNTLFSAEPAFAAGPGEGGRRVHLNDEPAGPYLLRVATSPTPPRVMNLYIEVRVTNSTTGEVIKDATVVIEANLAEDSGDKIQETASHDIAPIPTEYAAHLLVPSPGLWLITVKVDGPIGVGATNFLVRVNRSTSLGWLIAIGAPVAGLAILVVVFLRLQKKTQTEY